MNIVLRTLFGLHFFNDGTRTMIVALLPFIAKDLHLNLTQVGIIGSSQGLIAMLIAIPGGLIAARIGGIKMLFILMALYTICETLIGLTPNIPLLIGSYFLAAFGFGPFHVVGQALAARFSDKTHIGKNMSNFTVVGESGRVIFPAIALFVSSVYGWRFTILGTVALSVLWFLGFLWFWRKQKHKSDKFEKPLAESNKDWIKQLYIIVKQKKLLLIASIGFIDNIGGNSIYLFLPFLLLARGIHADQLGFFVGTFFLGTFTGKVVLGRAVDKLGNIKVLFAAETLMALFLFLLTINHWFWMYFVLSLFLGIFVRGTTPVVATLYTETSHANHYEKVYAAGEIFQGIAASLSAVILGSIADRFGITNAFLFAAGVAATVVIPIFLYKKAR